MKMVTECCEIVTMVKRGIFPRKAVFLVNTDGTYRQHNHNGMSELTNDFADLFLTMSANGWEVMK